MQSYTKLAIEVLIYLYKKGCASIRFQPNTILSFYEFSIILENISMNCTISGEDVRETGEIKKDQSTSDAKSNVKEKEQLHYILD